MASRRRTAGRRGKVRKEFWLDPKALRRAQTILGTETERETVERALELVVVGTEVGASVAAMVGLNLAPRG